MEVAKAAEEQKGVDAKPAEIEPAADEGGDNSVDSCGLCAPAGVAVADAFAPAAEVEHIAEVDPAAVFPPAEVGTTAEEKEGDDAKPAGINPAARVDDVEDAKDRCVLPRHFRLHRPLCLRTGYAGRLSIAGLPPLMQGVPRAGSRVLCIAGGSGGSRSHRP